jgi:hypothetical protein
MYIGLHVKYTLFLSDFNETWILLTNFWKILPYVIPRKSVQWEPSCSMRTDRQTDMTKLIVAARKFANAPKKTLHSAQTQHVWVPCNSHGTYRLPTMVLYSTMLPDMSCHLHPIYTFNNGLTVTQCCQIFAVPSPSNRCAQIRISCNFNPYAVRVLFRLFINSTHIAICCYQVAFPSIKSPELWRNIVR